MADHHARSQTCQRRLLIENASGAFEQWHVSVVRVEVLALGVDTNQCENDWRRAELQDIERKEQSGMDEAALARIAMTTAARMDQCRPDVAATGRGRAPVKVVTGQNGEQPIRRNRPGCAANTEAHSKNAAQVTNPNWNL